MLFRPRHVAKHFIVALDFDGTVANGDAARIAATKDLFGIDVSCKQITRNSSPLRKEQYERMTTLSGTKDYMRHYYELLPHVRDVLYELHHEGFRFAVVTSRPKEIMPALKWYIAQEHLPISHVHNTSHGPKESLVKRLRARVFLEDTLSKLEHIQHAPVELAYLRTPANSHDDVPLMRRGRIHQVRNWKEFRNYCLYVKNMHEAICKYHNWRNDFWRVQDIFTFWRSQRDLCNRLYLSYENNRS